MDKSFKNYEDFENGILLDTYKSIWYECKNTGNYKRVQKSKYPLEWLPFKIIRHLPKLKVLAGYLQRNKQGVDAYKYYVDVLENNQRGKWQNEFDKVSAELNSLGLSLQSFSVLDISGEPGYFAYDLKNVSKEVEVTAFAEVVANIITQKLGVKSIKYDFQEDDLAVIYKSKKFDFIFARYCIGFCINLVDFARQCSSISKNGSVLYLSFSPASRGVAARWMFEDYVYLHQYSQDYLISTFSDFGFKPLSIIDQGSFRWDQDMSWVQKKMTSFYLKKLFLKCSEREFYQHNSSVIFQKQ